MPSIYSGAVLKGGIDVTFRSLNEDPARVLVLPGVSEISKNFNIEVATQSVMTPGGGGIRRTVYVDTVAEDPQFTFTFPAVTPELLAMRYGRALVTETSVERYITNSNMLITGSGSYPASVVGKLGYAVAEDAESEASYRGASDEISVALTQSPFATFNAATETLAFAVGANGALKFSNDLIGKVVGYRIPATYTDVTGMGEGRFDTFSCNIMMIQNDRSILVIDIPEASIRADQGDITFGQPLQLTVSALAGGRCTGEQITWLGEVDTCREPVVIP
jgi:hypothetical protein